MYMYIFFNTIKTQVTLGFGISVRKTLAHGGVAISPLALGMVSVKEQCAGVIQAGGEKDATSQTVFITALMKTKVNCIFLYIYKRSFVYKVVTFLQVSFPCLSSQYPEYFLLFYRSNLFLKLKRLIYQTVDI